MICVIFGLIGTPLAIIAIADMGKFFSECLISFYMKLSSMHLSPKCLLKKLGGKLHWFRKTLIKTNAENDEYEELCRAKVHVPVILVLAAFFLYMLLGTVLFAYMENWAWMDSFYFCFITLTTIGFGDLVPNAQNKDLAVMLVYILLGLALTTMCIDLVAIRYIERIHQYGQSVKGPDLKKLLNRRRKRVRNLHISVTDLRYGSNGVFFNIT